MLCGILWRENLSVESKNIPLLETTNQNIESYIVPYGQSQKPIKTATSLVMC